MNEKITEQYQLWCRKATGDTDVINELKTMKEQEDRMEDAFYRNLEFGTGGLRGVIGAGTNRMNIYTVAKASQGLANYVKKHFPEQNRRIAVSYDSRIKSDLFAKIASGVFAANGIHVFIYPQLMPTPCLSFAVRYLNCCAGIMVTASHNPAKYNGYKVYGADGCQITTEAASEILSEIECLHIFDDVVQKDFDDGLKENTIEYIAEEVTTAFIQKVKEQSVLNDQSGKINKDVAIVYSPLNGTGRVPVLRTLKETGYTNITVVKEQEMPDGNFPTCSYPNPEMPEAMALGMEYARKHNADLLLTTDPDCDRVGAAVKNSNGDYVLITGNEMGVLLLDYICFQRQQANTMPDEPIAIKTIVTTDMAEKIAGYYGVRIINVLTGFKFIGEQIGFLESEHKEKSYIFGFEESYGYLSGTYVRDKDAVNGAFLICEMFAFYQSQGISLLEKLQELYDTYGYYRNTLHSFTFEGSAGFQKMQDIMKSLRQNGLKLSSKRIIQCLDYAKGLDGLPKSDVLKYLLEDNCSVVVRPSGTEPKLKLYISVNAENEEKTAQIEQELLADMKKYFA